MSARLRAARSIAGALVVASSGPLAAAACGGEAAVGGVRAPTASASSVGVVPSGSASAIATSSSSSHPAATATVTAAPASANDSPATQWLKSVPTKPVTAKVDALVWAAVPTDTDVRVGIYRVLAVSDTTAALQDLLRVRWEKVPGALMFPVGDPIRLKPDMLVTYADWRGFVGVGRVVGIAPKIRVTFRDASAVVREETANVAEPLTHEIGLLQWVAFPKPGSDALHKGLVFAIDGDKLFVRDEQSRAWVVDRAKAASIKVPAKRLKVGDAVRAYSGERGYRDGVVAKIFLPGLSYGVTADDETRVYFFSELALP